MYGLVAGNVLRHAPLASIVEEILAIIFEEVSLFLFLAVLSEEAPGEQLSLHSSGVTRLCFFM